MSQDSDTEYFHSIVWTSLLFFVWVPKSWVECGVPFLPLSSLRCYPFKMGEIPAGSVPFALFKKDLSVRPTDRTCQELSPFMSSETIEPSMVHRFSCYEVCAVAVATLQSERNPAASFFTLKLKLIEHVEHPANPSSIFRLGGLHVVDFLQIEQFLIENFQLSELNGDAATCEYRARPRVASDWANADNPKLRMSENASFQKSTLNRTDGVRLSDVPNGLFPVRQRLSDL